MIKQNKIYQVIRREILSGVWKPGERLPTETEYAQKFCIARNTLRAGLKKLEEEGFIERIKSKGTYVKIPKIKQEEKNISFLVPCCEYLQRIDYHYMKLMFELIAEAAAAGWRITPVIFSRTNNAKDIWWDNLSHFNEDSRIIINRKWFSPYFDTLLGIGASVAYISNEPICNDGMNKYTSQWINFIEETQTAAWKAFRFLQDAGCRKIAIAIPGCHFPDNNLLEGYRKLARAAEMKEIVIDLPPEANNNEEKVRDAYAREKFDGLIIHCNELNLTRNVDFRSCFGLDKDFPMVAIPNKTDITYLSEKIPIIEYRINELARDIVKCLSQGQNIPGQKYYYAPKLTLGGREIVIPED